MIPIVLHPAEETALKPYCRRNVTGPTKFTPRELVDKINALPDTTAEKALLVHYWNRLSLACSTGNAEAIAGWLTALALATHTAGFLLRQAKSRVKSTKALGPVHGIGTAATAAAGAEREAALRAAIDVHLKDDHALLNAKPGRLLAVLCREDKDRLKKMGYADSTALKRIGKILKEKRKG
jgi:hypothetical protein